MNKNEIIYWRNLHDAGVQQKYIDIENNVRSNIQKNGFLTKEDLKEIVVWKYEDFYVGRCNLFLRMIDAQYQDDTYIKEITEKALLCEDEKNRINTLKKIKSVGNALASVILMFYNPENYGVLDFHVYEELYGEKTPKNVSTNTSLLLDFFEKLRVISEESGLPCRDCEKALFRKHKDRNNNTSNQKLLSWYETKIRYYENKIKKLRMRK